MRKNKAVLTVKHKEQANRKSNIIAYCCILLLCIIYALFYGGFYPFMLLYMAISLPIMSLIYLAVIYFAFKSSQELNERVFVKGENASYRLHLENTSFFFIPYIKINMYIEGQVICKKMKSIRLSLSPFSKHVINYDIELYYRGLYDIGVSSIEIGDFFGLFTYTIYPSEKKTILVKPRIIEKYSLGDLSARISQGAKSHNYNDFGNDELINIKDYIYGESFRKIHWNLSSKLNKLMIRETKDEAKSEALFFLNLLNHQEFNEATLMKEDCLIEELVSHINYHLKINMSLRVCFFNGKHQDITGSTQYDFNGIYNVLSEVRFNQDYNYIQTLESFKDKVHYADLLYIFTVKLNADMVETILKLKNEGYKIGLYYIEYESLNLNDSKEDDAIEVLAKSDISAYRLKPSIISYDKTIDNMENSVLEGA